MAVFTSGIILALALLTKGTLFLSLPFLLPFIGRRKVFLPVAIGCALIFAPWIVRNWLTFGAFIALSTGGGHVLYGANNPYYPPGSWQWAIRFPNWHEYAALDEVSQDRALSQVALNYLRTQSPIQLLERGTAKLRTLAGSPVGVLWLLVMLGTMARRRWGRTERLCIALWAGLILNTVIFWGDSRFLFPIWSSVAIGAARMVKDRHGVLRAP
jgi:hypothetical protein